jgi:hypothetical protein
MSKRTRRKGEFFIHTEPAEMPSFGTGEAAELLGIPIWRLQKFLDSRAYNLSPAGKLGSGRGSRRMFSQEDLHRVALASWLIRDGFAPQFVGSVVERLEDDHVGVYIDHEGEEASVGIAFYRGADGPIVRTYLVRSGEPGGKLPPFYRLHLDDVFVEVDRKIRARS